MSNISSHRPSLRVNDNTTMKEADDFLAKAGHDGKKVYGKKDAQTGEITLYIKSQTNTRQLVRDKLNGLKAHFSGRDIGASHHQTKQSVGREGLQKIFANHERVAADHGLTPTGKDINTKVFSSMREIFTGQGSVGVGSAKSNFANQAIADVGRLVTTAFAERKDGAGAKLSDIAGNHLNDGVAKAVTDLRRNAAPSVSGLADAIVDGMQLNHPKVKDQFKLALGDSQSLKAALAKDIKANMDLAEPGHQVSSATIDKLANDAVDTALAKLSGARALDGPITSIADADGFVTDLPPVEVGNKRYDPVSFISAGGFGRVFEYVAQDGTKFAMKVPIHKAGDGRAAAPTAEELPGLRGKAFDELSAHLTAQGAGHPNILELKGAVNLPDGNIGIIMEFADGGSVESLQNAMSDPLIHAQGQPASGQITQDDIEILSLTYAADMLDGLVHLHDVQHATNFDVKTPNALFMLDANGLRAVLADFGTVVEGETVSMADAPMIEQPIYMSPELNAKLDDLRTAARTHRGNMDEAIRSFFPGLDDAAREELFEPLGYAAAREQVGDATIDTKTDIWSVGASFVSLISNQHVAFSGSLDQFRSGGGDAIQPLVQNPGNGKMIPSPTALFGTFGSSQATLDFANRMLKGDAAQRPDAWTLRRDPALSQPGVRTPEARRLGAAVLEMRAANKSGDAQRIATAKIGVDTARAALDAVKQAAIARASQPVVIPTFRTSVNLGDAPDLRSNLERNLDEIDATLSEIDELADRLAASSPPPRQPITRTISQEFAVIDAALQSMHDDLADARNSHIKL